jgi:hypothetical protein
MFPDTPAVTFLVNVSGMRSFELIKCVANMLTYNVTAGMHGTAVEPFMYDVPNYTLPHRGGISSWCAFRVQIRG